MPVRGSFQIAAVQLLPTRIVNQLRVEFVPDSTGDRRPTELDRTRSRRGRSQLRRRKRGFGLRTGYFGSWEGKWSQRRKNGDQKQYAR